MLPGKKTEFRSGKMGISIPCVSPPCPNVLSATSVLPYFLESLEVRLAIPSNESQWLVSTVRHGAHRGLLPSVPRLHATRTTFSDLVPPAVVTSTSSLKPSAG